MAIVYRRTHEGASTHALILGVGGYPRATGLTQKSSGDSAFALADWLIARFHNPDAPLGSVELLASGPGRPFGYPLPGLPSVIGLEAPSLQAVRKAVGEWRSRASSSPDNIALFYFVGEGWSHQPDTVLGFDDYGGPSGGETGTAGFLSLLDAMHGCPARQLYLVDCNRGPAGRSGPPPPPLLPSMATGGPPPRAVLYAAAPGGTAYRASDGRSFFNVALISALSDAPAARPGGAIRVRDLAARTDRALQELLGRGRGAAQKVEARIEADFDFCFVPPAPVEAKPPPAPQAESKTPPPPPTADPDAAPARRGRTPSRKRSGDSAARSEFPLADERQPPVGEPVGPLQDEEPVDGPADDEPVDGPPDDEPAEVPDDEPVDGPADDEPVEEPADDEPAEEPDDEPVDGPADDEPIEEPADDEPVEEPPDDEPDQAAPAGETNTEFIADDAETERDELARAVLAIGLARRLHRIWRNANEGAGGGDGGRAAFVVHLDAPWGGGKTTFANFLARVLDPLPGGGGPAAFLRQRYAMADVGGIFLEDPPADRSAAKRLAGLPAEVRRPWIVVPFNAWQVEHCSPPWWVFYQAIRKRCFDSILAEGDRPWDPLAERSRAERWGRRADAWWRSGLGRRIESLRQRADPAGPWHRPLGAARRLKLGRLGRKAAAPWRRWRARIRRTDLWLDLWLREFRWRLGNPKVRSLLITAAASLSALVLAWATGIVGAVARDGGSELGYLAGGVGLLLGGLGGVTGLWALGALFTESIVPGTDTLAERLSLGSGDPFERFRRHFALTMERVRRPVLVVVDDLDRCKPDFVVDIVRGMQTLLRSPRVVFVILGDRDWIERAFEAHHQSMSKVDVGPEQSFGARFVEKAIQMSFILPAMGKETRLAYVRRVLLGERADVPLPSAEPIDAATAKTIREVVNRESEKAGADPFDTGRMVTMALDQLAQGPGPAPAADPGLRLQVEQEVTDTLAINATTSRKVESGVMHQLEALAQHFPPNPRQIKRIVNAVTIYYAVALQRRDVEPDADFRIQLALWVIVMTEWPETWRLIASFPELLEIVQSSDPDATLAAPGFDLPGSPAAVGKAVDRILADPELKALIRGAKGPPLDRQLVPYLAQLTPLHSRKRRLEDDERKEPAAAVPAAGAAPRNGRAP